MKSLTSRFVSAATVIAVSAGLQGVLLSGTAQAADAWRPCKPAGSYWAPNDKDGSVWERYFSQNATKLRQTASTSASACGEGQPTHKVDLHCYRIVGGVYWNYVRDDTTGGWAGWVPDSQLEVVSQVPC
ncbi:hypothetical protein [Streptomyces sp. MB09-02B]|uniref:hypothetical protein n=1 Tax=Streptomyces sp. MB09-02B TaxID=3028667 RepID=UPI0029BD6461|nr:hypothetical protein [Streptomyces sp. MB09-02B]MDX3638539.1 hypothetical protein [Streptomyces sp. MB09-02B]